LTAGGKEFDDRGLVEAAKQDPARFAELYELTFERVYAYIARRVSNRDEAEDLTADVFHRALAHLNKFEWRGVPFAAWLFKIARNAIADRFGRSANESSITPAADPPEPSLEEIDERARLFRLVQRLPADQRRVIELRFAEGKTISEISRELKRSAGAVKQLQFRALTKLRTNLRKTHG
jgi:RNA polymerase sigma-70 factor, ECF subfamily